MIFPILSLLRRSASCVVFVDKPTLSLESKSPVIVCGDKGFRWENQMSLQMHQFSYKGPPDIASVEICKKENDIFKQINAGAHVYTLFVGPEEYVDGVRKSRIGVVRGVHRNA